MSEGLAVETKTMLYLEYDDCLIGKTIKWLQRVFPGYRTPEPVLLDGLWSTGVLLQLGDI